jgi:hypothetical protein
MANLLGYIFSRAKRKYWHAELMLPRQNRAYSLAGCFKNVFAHLLLAQLKLNLQLAIADDEPFGRRKPNSEGIESKAADNIV